MINSNQINAPDFEQRFESFLFTIVTEEYVFNIFLELKKEKKYQNSAILYSTITEKILEKNYLKKISPRKKTKLSQKINILMGILIEKEQVFKPHPFENKYELFPPNTKKRKAEPYLVVKNLNDVQELAKLQKIEASDTINEFETLFCKVEILLFTIQKNLHSSWLEGFFLDFNIFRKIYQNLDSIPDLEKQIISLQQFHNKLEVCCEILSNNPSTFFHLDKSQAISFINQFNTDKTPNNDENTSKSNCILLS